MTDLKGSVVIVDKNAPQPPFFIIAPDVLEKFFDSKEKRDPFLAAVKRAKEADPRVRAATPTSVWKAVVKRKKPSKQVQDELLSVIELIDVEGKDEVSCVIALANQLARPGGIAQ